MGIQDRLRVSFAHTPTRLVQSVDGGPPIQGLPIQGPILQFRPVLGTSGRINKCILSVNRARQEARCIDWIDQHLTAEPGSPSTHTLGVLMKKVPFLFTLPSW